MLDQLRDGDIVAVWKLDRLARSTRNLLEIVETIGNAGARFQSLSEPWANTTTHAGKMIMTIPGQYGRRVAQTCGSLLKRPLQQSASVISTRPFSSQEAIFFASLGSHSACQSVSTQLRFS
jgi:hypothetical protein